MIEKLKILIPNLKWIESTPCAIKADYGDHFTIEAINGHNGNGYAKYIWILDKNINNEIVEQIPNADELVGLAYSVYVSDKEKSKKEFYNLLNTIDEVIK